MSTEPEEPEESGQVSEVTNLRGTPGEPTIQQADGVPPAEDTDQEDQSRIEAEVSADHPRAEDVDDAVNRATGRDQG